MNTTAVTPIGALPQRVSAGSRRPASLGSTPPGTISLAMGEPFADTHPSIVQAAVEALHAGATRYAPMTGDPHLRGAIADCLSGRHPRPVTADQVVITHGASAGLAATILALVDPGDRVVIPEPTYSLYADHVAMAGGTATWVPDRPDRSLDLDRLAEVLPGARMVVVCDPGNPTGTVRGRDELTTLRELAACHGVYVLSDEAYADIVFDGRRAFSILDQPELADLAICCGTFSKTYAMTGWRLGWVIASPQVADAINLVHRSINGPVNTAVQHAGLAALQLPDQVITDSVAQYQLRRDLVVQRLANLDGIHLPVPQGAFYAFPRLAGDVDSDTVSAQLGRAGVLVRSGREYGPSGQGHIRISFATDLDTLARGLDRIRRSLQP